MLYNKLIDKIRKFLYLKSKPFFIKIQWNNIKKNNLRNKRIMIVDVHYHLSLADRPSPENARYMLPELLRVAKIMGIEMSEDVIIQRCCDIYGGYKDGKKLINFMDNAGIDVAVVNHVDNANNELLTPELNQTINKGIIKFV